MINTGGSLHRQAQTKGFSIHKGVAEVFTGLGVTPEEIRDAEMAAGTDLVHTDEQGLISFCREIVKISKPMIVVGNKVDAAPLELVARLKTENMAFSSAAGELALRNASNAHLIRYIPGDPTFSVMDEGSLSPAQKGGLAKIAATMKAFGGTGVQQALNHAVYSLLDRIVVYPVEDEHHYCDGKGRVLPDAFLMKKGSNPRDLAFQVHTDIGKGFLYAVDARTKMRVKDTHELKNGDIIRIVSTAR